MAITQETRKAEARLGAPSARSDQALKLGKINLIDLAHFARQVFIVKPLLGLSLLQPEQIQQSHSRLHGSFQKGYTEPCSARRKAQSMQDLCCGLSIRSKRGYAPDTATFVA
ncbi:hypothetical protein [Hyphomicrobium sp. DY-1]|uniref:hypothetical protein n=1 Tax=Hyphomicrobium sp. DY-1 TaxID=3075650 RepID=UPI0039C2E58C